jgi:uncharacterized protein (DUF1330 family)
VHFVPPMRSATDRTGEPMPAYLVVDVDVTDPAAFDEYRKAVPPTIAAYGGRYLARGGQTETLEGPWAPKRLVILEFPTMARLKEWYASPEYAPLLALRKKASSSNLIVTEGI